jgi:hypothetical protein
MAPLRYPRNLRLLIVAAATLLLGACTDTHLTSTWTNPQYNGVPMTKTAVIVIAKDENIRRYAEDEMVRRLPKGDAGVAGYTMFDKPEQAKVDEVRARLTRDGFDSVLVSRLVSMDKTQTYVPPQTYTAKGIPPPYYASFPGYYAQNYNTVYTTPGYTVENTEVVVETLLYRLSDGLLVWSGTTKSLNPQSKEELAQAIIYLIGNELKQSRMLGTPGK